MIRFSLHAFSIMEIPSDIKHEMCSKSIWSQSCPVLIENLKLVSLQYYNFAGELGVGEMVVLDRIAEQVIKIFKKLLLIKFPIHSIKLINHFNGDDHLSMESKTVLVLTIVT